MNERQVQSHKWQITAEVLGVSRKERIFLIIWD
jgi:hypothetical protein